MTTLRDRLIDTAIRLHIDEPLLRARATLSGDQASVDEKRQLNALLASTLTPTSNCVDIGAFRGRVLREIVGLAPHGSHIAYEPLPDLSRALARRFPSVDVRNAAVSNARGEATFTFVHDAPALSGLHDRWEGDGHGHRTEAVPVRVETLDEDLPPGYVPQFIKIDVEGAELQVFEGGIRTIATYKPTILFEHGKGGADHYGTEPGDVHALLTREADLRIYDLDGNGPLDRAQFEAAFARNEQWNFVARA